MSDTSEETKYLNLSEMKSLYDYDPHEYPGNYKDWQNFPANYSDDLLEIGGMLVMFKSEDPYQEKLAEIVTSNGGRILEIGFGMGISATYIQKYDIEEHIIVEANAEVFEKLQEFANSSQRKVTPIFGFWQDIVDSLPSESFDGVYFDPMPLNAEEFKGWDFDFISHGYRLLKKGGIYTQYYALNQARFEKMWPSYKKFIEDLGFSIVDLQIIKDLSHPEAESFKKNKLMWDILSLHLLLKLVK